MAVLMALFGNAAAHWKSSGEVWVPPERGQFWSAGVTLVCRRPPAPGADVCMSVGRSRRCLCGAWSRCLASRERASPWYANQSFNGPRRQCGWWLSSRRCGAGSWCRPCGGSPLRTGLLSLAPDKERHAVAHGVRLATWPRIAVRRWVKWGPRVPSRRSCWSPAFPLTWTCWTDQGSLAQVACWCRSGRVLPIMQFAHGEGLVLRLTQWAHGDDGQSGKL